MLPSGPITHRSAVELTVGVAGLAGDAQAHQLLTFGLNL